MGKTRMWFSCQTWPVGLLTDNDAIALLIRWLNLEFYLNGLDSEWYWTPNGPTPNPEWTQSWMDSTPNVLSPGWTRPRMDSTPDGLDPGWTRPQMDATPNGLDPEWTRPRMGSTPNGLNPEWTVLRMGWTQNGTQHRIDSTPKGTQPRMGLNPEWDSTLNGLNSEWDSTQNRFNTKWLSPFLGWFLPSFMYTKKTVKFTFRRWSLPQIDIMLDLFKLHFLMFCMLFYG